LYDHCSKGIFPTHHKGLNLIDWTVFPEED
jgi:hypothetical protein